MRTLCILPARGGSKRIPRKNIRLLAGQPLLARTIAIARQAGIFDEVMVSTEDDEIAGIATDAGAAVPFRRSVTGASDHASTTEVVQEVLAGYAARGVAFAHLCCLYPTAVLLEPARLRQGLQCLRDNPRLDSAMGVQAYAHPIERAYRLCRGELLPVEPANEATRTQDLAAAYHDAGQFYWLRPARFALTGSMLGDHCAPVVLAAWEAIDLDQESDWEFIERLVAAKERVGEELNAR